MRALLLASVSTFVMLAGCSSGGGLGIYLLSPTEVPEGCGLLAYDSEEGRTLQERFNWTGNPGRVDNEVFAEDGAVPIDNLVALYECERDDIASLVLRYASVEQVNEFADLDAADCQDTEERGVFNGPLVAFVEGDIEIPGMAASLDAWAQRLVFQTGATDPCAPAGSGNRTG